MIYKIYFKWIGIIIICFLLYLFMFLILTSSSKNTTQNTLKTIVQNSFLPICHYRIIHRYPHAAGSFTQGLILHHHILYESTGLYGRSKLFQIDLKQNKILKEHSLPDKYFGEGIAIRGDQLFQLTYKSHIGFVYDKKSFELRKTFPYKTEGWGLTTDQQNLIMSDGSSQLTFIDPQTFKIVKQLSVVAGQIPIKNLNALAFINGFIYANIWYADFIAKIDPKSGHVVAWIDLSLLHPQEKRISHAHVTNGITYDEKAKTFFVTGKCWPHLYEIKIIPS